MVPLRRRQPQDWHGLKRALLLIAVLVAPLVRAAPAAAAPAPPTAAIISPDLSGVAVEGAEYATAKARFDEIASTLAATQDTLATSANELVSLHADDTRLTNQLADETAARKQAVVAFSTAKTALRALAVDAYVHGAPDTRELDDIAVITKVMSEQTLTSAVSGEQVVRARDARNDVDRITTTLVADVTQRTDVRRRIVDVQATHDQAVADEAEQTVTLADRQADLDRARVTAKVVGEDFTLVALDAYWNASQALAATAPACGIPWWALAGITRVESHHGTFGGARLLADGTEDRSIVGVPLDGTNDTALIPDSDGGALDGDPVYDHAVGTMQFIPSTWKHWQQDGNGDHKDDPNNVYDAALAAAHYLCASGPMKTDAQLTRGFLSYNQSEAYAQEVLGFAKQYASFTIPPPSVASGG
jgi:membrane-bound lytic murein transglycosylase B